MKRSAQHRKNVHSGDVRSLFNMITISLIIFKASILYKLKYKSDFTAMIFKEMRRTIL